MAVAVDTAMVITCNAPLPKWVQLMRAEYREIPGLHLTKMQVQRLWGLDSATTVALLSELVGEGFLRENAKGAYVRVDLDR
jgi:hypothetical protein